MKKVKEGYKMTELGEIPNSWKVEMIDNLFDFYGGISISRDKQVDKGVFYLHYGDIHKKSKNYFSVKEDYNWLPKVDIDVNNLKEEVLLNTGDIVFADASEDYEGIGKSVVIINENDEPFVSGLHTIVAKDKFKELDTLYKKYCFSTTEVRKQFRALATGATVYGISRFNIKNIKILVPTIKEQEQIALTLSSVDEQIEITDNLIEKTKEVKRGLMQKLLTKGIGHSRFKDTEIGRIPEEWEVKTIGEVAKFQGGYAFKSSDYVDSGVKLVKITNVQQNNLVWDDMSYLPEEFIDRYSEYKLNYDDVVMAMTRPIISTGIKVCRVKDKDIPSFLNQRVGRFVVNSKLDNGYLYQYTFSNYFINKVNELSSTTGQPNISSKQVESILIPVPEIQEQKRIAIIISSVDKQMEQYESKKEKLQELKKGLMQKLLTGRIRVNI